MTQIFLVEDHPIMRQSLRSLLEREADLVVSGEAQDAESALEQIGQAQPDLVLIDVSLPGMNGIQLARVLRSRHPEILVAMLSGHEGKTHVEQALLAGARGYILKGHARELPTAVRSMVAGSKYVSVELRGDSETGN